MHQRVSLFPAGLRPRPVRRPAVAVRAQLEDALAAAVDRCELLVRVLRSAMHSAPSDGKAAAAAATVLLGRWLPACGGLLGIAGSAPLRLMDASLLGCCRLSSNLPPPAGAAAAPAGSTSCPRCGACSTQALHPATNTRRAAPLHSAALCPCPTAAPPLPWTRWRPT